MTSEFVAGQTQTFLEDGTLHFCEGTFPASMQFKANLSVHGHGTAILEGWTTGPIAKILTDGLDVHIDGLEFRNGAGEDYAVSYANVAGGLVCDGFSNLSIDNTKFVENSGSMGGALCANSCTVEIRNSDFESNEAVYGGAVYFASNSVTVENSTFTQNVSSEIGGGLYSNGSNINSSLVVANSQFTENSAKYGGGIGLMRVEGSYESLSFDSNAATGAGGGIFPADVRGTPVET